MSEREPTPFDPLGPLAPGVTLLEASAGTGKTYSITSLFVRLVIEHDIAVDRILAVTFTQAATAELTSRIRKRLGEAHRVLHEAARQTVDTGGDEVLAYLADLARRDYTVNWAERARNAVVGFDRANITTIHGFCQRMLSQHALEAQVPFGVQLIEDQAQLVQEIADDFWVREVASAEPWELQALATLGVDLASMRRLAQTAVMQWEALPVPEPLGFVARPDPSALVAAITRASHAARHAGIAQQLEQLTADLRGTSRYLPKHWTLLPRTLDGLAQGRASAKDFEVLRLLHEDSLRTHLPNRPLPSITRVVSELLDAYDAWRPLAEPWALSLRHAMVTTARAEHSRRTAARGVWTFDDLLRSLRDALVSTARPDIARALAAAIGGRFKAVLIDEFQDTDPVQWDIFRTVFANRHHHLYLIGDPKQAIYGFRRADVMTYLEAGKLADQKHTLSDNHRSDGPLVDALNHLFSLRNPERVFAVEGIPYRGVTAKKPARVEGMRGAPVRLLWLKRGRHTAAGRGRDPETARISGRWGEEHLPSYVAADIFEHLQSGIMIKGDDGEMRPVAPDDLAVLVHKNEHAVKVQDALRRLGVPAVVHGPRSVFETEEAYELLRVLTAVLDPSRLQNVRAALVTRLLGVTALELARWERLGPGDERKLEEQLDRLRGWREAWHKRSFIEAFRKITSERVDALLALEDGERRLANTLQLGELLHLAVAQKELKPPGLVAWLERQIQRADKTDERQQVRLETDEPAVQVVTIHKAKGLEYPFVWCPFPWQKANQDFFGRRLPDFIYRDHDRRPRLQIGLDDKHPERVRAHKLQVYGEQSERLRAFYVALTRAKHQVTLYGGAFWDLTESPLGYTLLSTVSATDADSLAREIKPISAICSRRDEDVVEMLESALPRELFSVALAHRPQSVERREAARQAEPETLAARTWPASRQLDTWWRRTSFSGLVYEAAGDHEDRAQAASDEDAKGDLFSGEHASREVELADLPSGRAIGNLIHKILELADFTRPEDLPALVLAELSHFAVDPLHAPSLTRALQQILVTPLDAHGLVLADLPPPRRLPELDFVFPVAGGYDAGPNPFTPSGLVHAFRAFGDRALDSWLTRFEALDFARLRGFLSGSIDLAFQSPRDGRWYVLDWKSNHLGRSARDYAGPRLREAMDHHHYHLQYHLYSVALCRYLKTRIPGFDVARDFGGIFYLFLRGMHPEHPLGTGVFHDRPSPELIAELERQFRGEGGDPRQRGQLELL